MKHLCGLEKEKKLNYVILRFGTIYGVSKGMRFHTAVNRFCLDASLNKSISVYKTALNQFRPYLSLNDAFKLFKFTIENDFFKNDELIFYNEKSEVEIAYLGLAENYHNQKLGSYLLSSAIKNSFECNPQRVWVHTCSLDHKNALMNYTARGMKIFKKETITV